MQKLIIYDKHRPSKEYTQNMFRYILRSLTPYIAATIILSHNCQSRKLMPHPTDGAHVLPSDSFVASSNINFDNGIFGLNDSSHFLIED